jgi:3-oxoacyl-[acyl-carrier-protein] synthase II
MNERPVVITGLGAVSPFGPGVVALWSNVAAGRCAIRPTTRFTVPGDITPLSATIPDEFVREINQDFGGQVCRWTMEHLLVETLASAGLTGRTLSGRGAVFFCNHFDQDAYQAALSQGGQISPANLGDWSLDHWANWLAAQTGAETALGIITACTGANLAISLGYDWISRGRADWALVGGMDMLHPELFIEMDTLRMLSSTGCRPFSADHDGTVLGDGGGLLLLERLDLAQERGAPNQAELLGYGMATDTFAPGKLYSDGRSAYRALTLALEKAGLQPADVGYVSASATGSPAVDEVEIKALLSLFEEAAPPTSALKSQIGHSIGGSAALEAIVTIKALQEQRLPPTLGLAPYGSYPLDFVPEPRPHTFSIALNNAIAMSGHICTTVFKRGY